ncbi:MAG: CHASE domain-containing protein [Methyloversatilis sp.]|jgi:diguanylate cyclase (GGDEF)-like protein/PAS domain S-box-containing protein|nr:CHASE domain-containing protein [Methyloversatilis sp.]MBP6192764.1 CHASE domain-containing protein [Methyloversatilis sp.]MBP9118349.1 CHASE domain-containing protein [Methyloversatilis sp.]
MNPAHSPVTEPAKAFWQIAVPVLAASVIAALAVLLVWKELDRRHHDRVLERLALEAREVAQTVEQRMRAYRQVLRGARALFDASDNVTRDDWRAYVGALALEQDHPGIQGVGFAVRVDAADLDAHVARMRDRGHAGYRIKPSGARAEYSSIIYLEPFNWRNQRAFAYDMLSEPVRGEAMRRARSTGEAALSGKVRLIQETDRDVQTGVLLYLPAYHHGMPTDTVEQRTAALAGWAYSPFRMDDLMRGTLGKASDSLRLRIHDGPESLPDSLLYDSHPGDPVRHGAAEHSVVRDIDGRRWTLMFEIREESAADTDRWRVELALMALFGALLVTLTGNLALARRRAAQLALLSASLAHSEEMYSTLVNLSGESIMSLDRSGRIAFANPALCRTLNVDAAAVTGQPLEQLADDGGRQALQAMSFALLNGEHVRMELTMSSVSRGEVVMLASGVPRLDNNGQITGAIIVMADISERKADEMRIAWLATHDTLTGLPNRSLLTDRLARALTASQRYRHSFCVLFIDLDHFKEINDRMGHQAGDAVLIEASRRMLACLRAADTLARHGGDEFVALLSENGTLDGGLAVAEKIRSALCQPFALAEGQAQISASVGVVMCPEHGNDLDVLMARADAAMYAAKAAGRNTIATWNPHDSNQDNFK